MHLFSELKRRNVFRVAAAYLVAAWLILQVADLVLNNLGAPAWAMQSIILLAAIGLPLTLVIAWAYELTPEGVKRETDVDSAPPTPQAAKLINIGIIVTLVLAVAVLLVDRLWLSADESRSEGSAAKSIAVLPFDDFSAQGEGGWFAAGLAEEILNVLARTPDLLVASRTSAFRFGDSTLGIPEIAERLGVAHVLEGSVRRSPQRIRVTVQLIRGSDGLTIWSKSYDRQPSELIAIQENIALSIAQALETAMDPEALENMLRAGTRSVAAYKDYLRGLALTSSANAEGSFETGKALQAFEAARRHDPDFAEAAFEAAKLYREMSNTTVMVRSSEISGEELRRGFESAIRDAIQAAGDDVTRVKYEALQAEAALRLREAQSKFDDYLKARPKDLQAWTDYAYVSKKLRDAAAVRRSVANRLDLAAQDAMIAWEVGVDLVQINATEEAAEQFHRALELNPGDVSVQYQAHRAFLWAGMREQAARLEQALLASNMAEIYLSNVRMRAACARGNREAAEAAFASKPASDLYGRWHGLTLLGRRKEAAAVLMPLDETARGRDDLAGYMVYSQFDPSRYPRLSAILARHSIESPGPVAIPFACPPD